jgi:hypothetical protein
MRRVTGGAATTSTTTNDIDSSANGRGALRVNCDFMFVDRYNNYGSNDDHDDCARCKQRKLAVAQDAV